MPRTPRTGWVPGLIVAMLLLGMPLVGRAEPPKGQKITFETIDGVRLEGTFYPSAAEGTRARCVLLLHRYGGSRDEEGWDTLARLLQEKGFAALAFDFRGHGDSTTISSTFWEAPQNQHGLRNAKPGKDTIGFKEFRPEYLPMLVNDIAAAKNALEKKNNAKDCNVGDVIVIGAEEGATLGLLWVASEASRYRQVITAQGTIAPAKDPEIKDINAVVCLSLKTAIEKRPMPLGTWVNAVPKFKEKVPVCLLYGKDDPDGERAATSLFDGILKLKAVKGALSVKHPIEGTKLAGTKLLASPDLKVDELVASYLELLTDKRAAQVWGERELQLNKLSQLVPLANLGITLP